MRKTKQIAAGIVVAAASAGAVLMGAGEASAWQSGKTLAPKGSVVDGDLTVKIKNNRGEDLECTVRTYAGDKTPVVQTIADLGNILNRLTPGEDDFDEAATKFAETLPFLGKPLAKSEVEIKKGKTGEVTYEKAKGEEFAVWTTCNADKVDDTDHTGIVVKS